VCHENPSRSCARVESGGMVEDDENSSCLFRDVGLRGSFVSLVNRGGDGDEVPWHSIGEQMTWR